MENEYFASINDVSKRLAVPAYTLRYWEKQFPAAVRPTTGAGGRRYYRAETVKKLETIKSLLYNHGMTIAGVKKLIRDGNFPANPDDFAGTIKPDTPIASSVNVTPVRAAIPVSDIDTAIGLLESARALLK